MGLSAPPSARAVRFGPFTLNLRSGELRQGTVCVRLQEQALRFLCLLLQSPGVLVTRKELRETLWGQNTFVDFNHGINVIVAKLRGALADSSKEPRFIVTVGRRGYRFIARVEPVPEEIPDSARPSGVVKGQATFHSVGRQPEQAALLAALGEVSEGRGLLVCVAGEPGIGKTTLVEEFLFELQANGRRFLLAKGRCSERLAGSEAYLPFLEALGSLLSTDRGELRSRLRTLAPSWYTQLFPPSESDAADSMSEAYARAATQERLKREIATFLEEAALLEPLLLFFDDLHWADPSTIDLLGYLSTKFDHARLLVIGAYRSSEMLVGKHPFVGLKLDLQARGTCREIEVEFLSRNDVQRYLALEFPESDFGPEFAALIHSRTEGNPLFMVDLVRYLRDQAVIAKPNGDLSWHLARSIPDLSGVLPISARSMIERKMELVAERDREVLAAAAVQGHQFDSATVARSLGAESAEVEESVGRLDRIHGLVRREGEEELPDGTLTLRCRFVHALYQNALFASMTPTRRASLSAAIAHALEAFHGDHCSAIASQMGVLYETARNPERASYHYLSAAQNARRVFANLEATALSRRGLAQVAKSPDTPERRRRELGLQMTLVFALMSTVGYGAPETGVEVGRARELCQAFHDDAFLVPILVGLTAYYHAGGNLRSAREVSEHMLRISLGLGDPTLLLAGHLAMTITLHHQGELLPAHRHFEELTKVYDPSLQQRYVQLYGMDPGIHAEALMVRLLWLLGFPDQARRKIVDTLGAAQLRSSPLSFTFFQMFATFGYQGLREPESAKELGAACIAHCDEQGIQAEKAWAMVPYGWALTELNDVDRGISLIRAGLAAQLAVGVKSARTQSLAILADALRHAGRMEAAQEAIEEGLAASERNGERFFDAELWRLKGVLTAKQEVGAAELCFRNAIDISRQQAAKSLELRASTSLARHWLAEGKRAEAHRLLAGVYSWFTEGFDTADLREAASLMKELS